MNTATPGAPQGAKAYRTNPSDPETYRQAGASAQLAYRLSMWHQHLHEKKIAVLIYCIYRSPKEQAALYAIGRTVPGRRVTNAQPGRSAHNRSEGDTPASDAFDACPLIDGKPSWDTHGPALRAWEEMGRAARALGLQWGRNIQSLGGDWAHFQLIRTIDTPKGITV